MSGPQPNRDPWAELDAEAGPEEDLAEPTVTISEAEANYRKALSLQSKKADGIARDGRPRLNVGNPAVAAERLREEVGNGPLAGMFLRGDQLVHLPRIGEEGSHSLYDLGNSQSVQLLQLGPDSLDAPLAAIIPLGITGFDRLEAVGRLLAVLHDRAIPPDRRLTRQQRARARRMLQAFDGARDGATQQEIAQVIFRVGRVARDDWQASSTRHAIMSLLRDARGMVEGGYRKFLRHRHRH